MKQQEDLKKFLTNLSLKNQQYILARIQSYRRDDDHEAYYELLKKVNEYLQKVLFRKISNEELREDTSQEIMLAIHKSLHTYDETKKFLPWVNSIIFHKTIDYYRKQSRISSWENIEDKNIESLNITPEDKLTVKEILERLSEEVFGTQFLEQKLLGASIEEVAASVGLSKSNTKVTMHRIAKKIKKDFV